MYKKILVLGGGTGMSSLLKGLKDFPLSITAIVSVCDDGQSTGRLRKEFGVPAMGDIRKVLVALSGTDDIIKDALQYRFETNSDLNGHPVGNLLLTSLMNMTGSLKESIEALSKLLKVKGTVLPLTEDLVTLIGKMEDHTIVEGQHFITDSPKRIIDIDYKQEISISKDVRDAIRDADYILFSMGSLYTSIIPNIISKEIQNEIDKSKAKLLYICNIMTQPGETEKYTVSNHIKELNRFLGKKKIEAAFVNTGEVETSLIKKYETLEQKDLVKVDQEEIEKCVKEAIYNNYAIIENGVIRHDNIKISNDIFSYIISKEEPNVLYVKNQRGNYKST